MRRKKSVLLLSGGLDSAANLALCAELDQPILTITARYGQRASHKEVEAAKSFSQYYNVPHQIVDLPWLGELGGSSLTQSAVAIPQLERNQLDDQLITEESARSVWVPNRNGILLHVAAAYAERMKAEQVVVGFNIEEAATFPDNSIEYLNRVTAALALSTANQVRAFSYTSSLNKKEIVEKLAGVSKRFPFESVWSCYYGNAAPCGKCESCQRFLRATSGLAPNKIP